MPANARRSAAGDRDDPPSGRRLSCLTTDGLNGRDAEPFGCFAEGLPVLSGLPLSR